MKSGLGFAVAVAVLLAAAAPSSGAIIDADPGLGPPRQPESQGADAERPDDTGASDRAEIPRP